MAADLLTVTTQAVLSVRQQSDSYGIEPTTRKTLNLQQLRQIILYGHLQDESERPVKSGRKRSAPLASGSKKRAKRGASPSQDSRKAPSAGAEQRIPVYAHRFELAYTTNWKKNCDAAGVVNYHHMQYADDQHANDIGWVQEEKQLFDALAGLETLSPRTFELSEVALRDHWGVTQLYIGSPSQFDDDEEHDYGRYLLTLPSYNFHTHPQDDQPRSLFSTCWSLVWAGHVSMSASASIVYIPGVVAPELPIRLHVTVCVSLIIPTTLPPISLQVPVANSIEEERRRLLSYFFHYCLANKDSDFTKQKEKGSLTERRNFYAILEPAPQITSSLIYDALQPRGLRATLLPFQKRTVKWLLERERKTISPHGQLVPYVEDPQTLPLFWKQVCIPVKATMDSERSTGRSTWYFNRLTGSLINEPPPSDDIVGAMLCEEMGLGKTLECIALILLNPAVDRNPATTSWDPETELHVSPVKTNLIVTPTTLSQQWLDELERHAPGLRVLSYLGYNKVKFSKVAKPGSPGIVGPNETHRLWCSYIQEFDVIVTTYNVLSQELGVARAPVIRPKRQVASYSHVEKPRSPLVRVEWARVFMDEVQLVGGGKTAEMVSLIPRHTSIAVSGTPAKSKISDLSHVLQFLRVHQAVGSGKTWDSLMKPEFDDLFSGLFKKYAVRTLKSRIQDELTIPSQSRFAVGIELGKVERHIYDLTLQEALDELGVDGRGVAASPEWQLDVSLLRTWLRRLRQVCTHPQVGNVRSNKTATKVINSKTIKTIEEVLQGYQEQNWNSLVAETKTKIHSRIRRAQFIQLADDVPNRYQDARGLLLSALTEVDQLLTEVKATIATHEERRKEIIEEAAVQRHERTGMEENHDFRGSQSKGKGKARDLDVSDSDDDSDDDGLPKTPLGDEYRARQRNLQGRLREVYVLQHKVHFLLGDVYHVLGASFQEEASYAAAETVRRKLLKSSEGSVVSSMRRLPAKDDVAFKKELRCSLCQKGGIRSAHLMDEANEVFALLNEQGELLWKWRSQIFRLLTQKLYSTEGEQADGEEYARTLDTQGEAEVYLEAYTALIADRKEVLIAERTALAAHDDREKKLRKSMVSKEGNYLGDDFEDPEEAEPEHQVLQQELADQRKGLKDDRPTRALRTVMFQLNEIGNRAGNRPEETTIAKEEAKRLRKVITEQGAVMEKFELELAAFRKVFNDRIQYFKQLQELSDSVVQPEWSGDIRNAIEASKAEEEKATLQANAKRAGQRHFNSIAKDRAEGELDEEDCILCGEPFQRGVMTPCGHIFCGECIMGWLKHRKSKTHLDCPMCRSNVEINAMQRITLTGEEFDKQLKKHGTSKADPRRSESASFNTLPQKTLDEIETFEAHGSYGSKIAHLIRHLLYLQNQEPGTKSVVFSAWSDSLTIIQQALLYNGISSIRVDQKGTKDAAQKFKTDPGLQVFLLHGERENAGLNLTCAKRVWLIEPTVNHAFEMQAISRVDRMGQTSATEVFCYYIQDTVEENILQMGARRGLSLYTKEHSRDAIDISDFAMGVPKARVDSPSKKEKQKGDFIAQTEDLIHVLFPHLDVRDEDFAELIDVPRADQAIWNAVAGPSVNGSGRVNAEAGPSRLG